jgi:hypothetical protein
MKAKPRQKLPKAKEKLKKNNINKFTWRLGKFWTSL